MSGGLIKLLLDKVQAIMTVAAAGIGCRQQRSQQGCADSETDEGREWHEEVPVYWFFYDRIMIRT